MDKTWRYWWGGRSRPAFYKVNPSANYPDSVKDWPWAMWWKDGVTPHVCNTACPHPYSGKGMGFFGGDIGNEWWPGCTDR